MPNRVYDNNSGAVIYKLTPEEQKVKNLEEEVKNLKEQVKLIEDVKESNRQMIETLKSIDTESLKKSSKTKVKNVKE